MHAHNGPREVVPGRTIGASRAEQVLSMHVRYTNDVMKIKMMHFELLFASRMMAMVSEARCNAKCYAVMIPDAFEKKKNWTTQLYDKLFHTGPRSLS